MKLKDVIHYYIWQKCVINNDDNYKIVGYHKLTKDVWILQGGMSITKHIYLYDKGFKLSLRKIDSLTDDELEKAYILLYDNDESSENYKTHVVKGMILEKKYYPVLFHYLLSIGIDLFNLIDNGQALDINDIKTQKQ